MIDTISHIYREANCCVDILADMGHLGGFQWTILQHAPFQLSLALDVDARGVALARIVH